MKNILILTIALLTSPVNAQVTKFTNGDVLTQTAASATYVFKAGDTMTGPLTVPDITVSTLTATSGKPYIAISTKVYNTVGDFVVKQGARFGDIGFPNYWGYIPNEATQGNGLLMSAHSLRIGIDADNNETNEELQITANTSSASGGTALLTINESGYVTIPSSMTVDTASNTLVVDSVNHRIGVLTNTPGYPLSLVVPTQGIWLK